MRKILTLIMTLALTLGISAAAGIPAADEAFAASASCSVKGGSCTVGKSITVTVTFSSGNQLSNAQMNLSYDSSILTLTGTGGSITSSNGSSYLLESTSGAKSLSATFTFKAKKAGNAKVSASASLSTWDTEESISGVGGSGTVKVTEAKKSSSSKKTTSSSGNTNKRGEFNESSTGVPADKEEVEEKKPEPKPAKVEVKYQDKTWTIVEDLKEEEIPLGFKAAKATYGEWDWEIVVYTDENGHTLVCLEDSESKERQFFTYKDSDDSFGNSISVTVAQYLDIDKTKAELQKTQAQVKELEAKPNLLPALIAAVVVAVVSLIAAIVAFLKKKGPVFPKEE